MTYTYLQTTRQANRVTQLHSPIPGPSRRDKLPELLHLKHLEIQEEIERGQGYLAG